jgi:hypothetical protein
MNFFFSVDFSVEKKKMLTLVYPNGLQKTDIPRNFFTAKGDV